MQTETTQEPSLLVKILRFPPVTLAVLYYGLMYIYLAAYFHRTAFAKTPPEALWSSMQACIVMALAYAAFVMLVEGRKVTELAIAPAVRELPGGLFLGFALYTMCILILMAMGHFQITGTNAAMILIGGLAGPLCTGFFEELVFRAGLFRIAEQWVGTWAAILVSSVVFGFVHMGNEAATIQGLISISIWAGLLLSACYILTRRLWLGIGLHAAWNYTQGSVYSGIVSGNGEMTGYFKSQIEGPDILTGGSFGVEASVVALIVCTSAGVFMMMMAVKRGNIIAPRWMRSELATA
jgi:membrane protease YdiL (CAAX protease family)